MRNWIKRFLAPPHFAADEEKSRIASLLNVILLALTAVFIINTINAVLFNPAPGAIAINALTVLVTIILLGLLRLRYVTASAWATVIIFWALVTAVGYFVAGLSLIVITSLFVLVVLAGVVAGNRSALIILGLNIVVIGFLFYLENSGQLVAPLPGTPLVNVTASSANMAVLTLLIALTLRTLNNSLRESRLANQELQDNRANLETRVASRTRDLALAVEVGRNLTQVRDLNTLLNEATELIRHRFDLYHVQIYLANISQQSLLLRAGTGQAGQELLRRRHSLPINAASINGSAAMSKKPVLASHTQNDALFLPNPLLPETRSELAVPLLVGGRVLGVLDLQSATAGGLQEDAIPVFETVASQLAIAIDNANLFAAASQAQAEVESYLRQLSQESWSSYLDAISREEKLAFVYDVQQSESMPVAEVVPISADRNALQLPLTVTGVPIGAIQVEAADDQHWTEEAISLVDAVAQQVAQRVENLRLLNEAQHYRLEAETAVRKLSQESWQDQIAQEPALAAGFIYDQNRVKPLTPSDEGALAQIPAVAHPLHVRGEVIGSLALHGDLSPEAREFVEVISARLSEHLENLRLSQQTETALNESRQRSAELSALNLIAQAVSAQLDVNQLIDEVQRQLVQVVPMDSFTLGLYHAKTKELSLLYVFDRASGVRRNLPPVKLQPHMLSYKTIYQRESQLVLYTVEEVAAQQKKRPANVIADTAITASHLFVPLLRGQEVMGVLSVQSYQLNAYDESDLNLLNGVASYVATAMQNAELFAEIQRRGAKERIINTVTQRIQSTLTMEEALQTAVSELGKALKASSAQVELTPDIPLTYTPAKPTNGTANLKK